MFRASYKIRGNLRWNVVHGYGKKEEKCDGNGEKNVWDVKREPEGSKNINGSMV